MPVLETAVQRLSPSELTTTPYRRLAQTIFGASSWENHVSYCRWLYGENPASEPGEPLPIYVYWDGDESVGQTAIIPVEIVLAGQPRRAGWCVDFFILPTHQRRGIGSELLAAAHEDFPLLMSIGQTDASRGLIMKFGWRECSRLTLYKRLLRPLRCVSKRALHKVGLIGPIESASLAARRPPRPPRGVVATPVTSAASIDDGLLEHRRSIGGEAYVRRSPAFLRWRYLENPMLRYTVMHLKLSAHVEAYAVWRMVDDVWRSGLLVDLVYADVLPPAEMRLLAGAVMDSVRAAGADVFECQTSDAALLAALPGGVCTTRRPGVRFLYGEWPARNCPQVPAEDWKFYSGDCDIDALAGRGESS